MTLTPEQKATMTTWVAAGDNLSTIQKKLSEQYKLTLTYMDVRFLVDDLDLTLKDPAPAPQPDLSKPPPAPPAPPAPRAPRATPPAPGAGPLDDDLDNESLPPDHLAQRHPRPSPYKDDADSDDDYVDDEAVPPQAMTDAPPAGTNVRVELDNVTVIPNAIASGTVTFTDGVTGKWYVDTYGRPGFTQISQPGYRPTQADAQAFMQELSAALQKRGY